MKNGDLILLDFTAKVKDTGDLIETTIEDEAKKTGNNDTDSVFKPKLVAIGEGWVLKGLDEALVEAEIGKQINVQIEPEKGFGTRDSSKTRLIPLRKFRDRADQLNVGAEIEIDGRIGIVRFIGSGRAQIDFNHRYAGRTIEYSFNIVKKIEDDKEKIQEIIDRRIPDGKEKTVVNIEQNIVTISIPEEYFLLEGLQIIKRATSNEIMKYVENVVEISFTEKFKNTKNVKDTNNEQREVIEEVKDTNNEQSEVIEEVKDTGVNES